MHASMLQYVQYSRLRYVMHACMHACMHMYELHCHCPRAAILSHTVGLPLFHKSVNLPSLEKVGTYCMFFRVRHANAVHTCQSRTNTRTDSNTYSIMCIHKYPEDKYVVLSDRPLYRCQQHWHHREATTS
jgi:hypothetical protein